MVLVEESHRSQGYGTTIFRRALDAALDATDAVGLDATDLGVPVYEKEEFVPVEPIVRWAGTPAPATGTNAGEVPVESLADAGGVAAYDRTACGVDREPLLARLLSEDDATGLASRRGGEVRGYGLVRPGREYWHLGPVVADDRATVRALLGAAGEYIPDGEGLLFDALAAPGDPLSATLDRAGLAIQRELTRMTHGRERRLLAGGRAVAAAGFELG